MIPRPVETGFVGNPAQTRSEEVASRVSRVTNPLIVALPLFLAVSLATASTVPAALGWWVVLAVGISVGPLLFIRRGVRRGHLSDAHVSIRAQRLLPLSFGLLCMVLVLGILWLTAAPRPLIAAVVAALSATGMATAITHLARYKMSLHLVGVTGSLTICGLLFGVPVLFLLPLLPVVFWARWKVGAHTWDQAAAGSLLAVLITVAAWWCFGLF